jgi:hypothetical protein
MVALGVAMSDLMSSTAASNYVALKPVPNRRATRCQPASFNFELASPALSQSVKP